MIQYLALFLLASTPDRAGTPELVSDEKIWDRAPHSAFTDLIRFSDGWLCTFREAESHGGSIGKVRVIGSEDARNWTSLALLEEEGIDLRDPKLSIMPERVGRTKPSGPEREPFRSSRRGRKTGKAGPRGQDATLM